MKKMLVLALGFIFLFSTICLASPWLACDPYPQADIQPDYFLLSIDPYISGGAPGVTKITGQRDADGWKLYDLANYPAGTFTARIKACKAETAETGEACSAEAVFTFTLPMPKLPGSPPKAPNMKLTK